MQSKAKIHQSFKQLEDTYKQLEDEKHGFASQF